MSMVSDASLLLPNSTRERARVRLPLVQQYLDEQKRLTAVERFSQRHEADALAPGRSLLPRSLAARASGPGTAARLSGRPRRVHRLQGVRHGVSPPERARRRRGRNLAQRGTFTRWLGHGAGAANGDDRLSSLPRTGMHEGLPGQRVRERSRDRDRQAPRRSVHRLPVLHAHVSLRGPAVQQEARHRPKVRHVLRPARRGRGPGLRSGLSERGHLRSAWSIRRRSSKMLRAKRSCPERLSPTVTVPTTLYKTQRAMPRNLLPADFHRVRTSHQHFPLVVLLVLTQLSVGAFVADVAMADLGGSLAIGRPQRSLLALAMGLLALGASTFHLGRPAYAFRAVLGIRTSWMSREMLAFGLYAGSAMLQAALYWVEPVGAALGIPVPSAATLDPVRTVLGLTGRCERRPRRGLLGDALPGDVAPLVERGADELSLRAHVRRARARNDDRRDLLARARSTDARKWRSRPGARSRVRCSSWLRSSSLADAEIFVHLRARGLGELKRTALLLVGELRRYLGRSLRSRRPGPAARRRLHAKRRARTVTPRSRSESPRGRSSSSARASNACCSFAPRARRRCPERSDRDPQAPGRLRARAAASAQRPAHVRARSNPGRLRARTGAGAAEARRDDDRGVRLLLHGLRARDPPEGRCGRQPFAGAGLLR